MGQARVTGVPAEAAGGWWPTLEGWAREALEHTDGLFGLDHIQEAVARRDMQLWLIRQPDVRAFCVTEITDFPLARVLTAVLVGGEGMPDWIGALDAMLTRYGEAHGCAKFNAYGRRGWRPFARGLGWSEAVTYWKDLAGE